MRNSLECGRFCLVRLAGGNPGEWNARGDVIAVGDIGEGDCALGVAWLKLFERLGSPDELGGRRKRSGMAVDEAGRKGVSDWRWGVSNA